MATSVADSQRRWPHFERRMKRGNFYVKDMCPCPTRGTMHTRGLVDIACASLLRQETGLKLKGVCHRVVSTLRRPAA